MNHPSLELTLDGDAELAAAAEIERAVIDQLRGLLRAPEIVVRTWRAARETGGDISEAEVRQALERLDPLWDELFPAEQARIVQLLVERVEVHPDRLNVRLQVDGQNLTNVVDVIDFGGLFSGNAIGPSRSCLLRLAMTF